MKIGLGLPVDDPDVLLDWARRADAGPFSTLGLLDRLAWPNPEPLVTLAVLAGATHRIRLQTEVLLAPLRGTALLGSQAATLDRLSGGRFTLGLGIGGRAARLARGDPGGRLGVRGAGGGRGGPVLLGVRSRAGRPAGRTARLSSAAALPRTGPSCATRWTWSGLRAVLTPTASISWGVPFAVPGGADEMDVVGPDKRGRSRSCPSRGRPAWRCGGSDGVDVVGPAGLPDPHHVRLVGGFHETATGARGGSRCCAGG